MCEEYRDDEAIKEPAKCNSKDILTPENDPYKYVIPFDDDGGH